MLGRTRWRTVESSCSRGEASGRWAAARSQGATGAVTSWGSGIEGRNTLRLFWEVVPGVELPVGEDLEEENWTPFWRESLAVIEVTDRITLVPSWEEPPGGVPCPIRIDPGMAFGAGDHPSTRLCLRLLEGLAAAGRLPTLALDVGAGTGVLSLAAACLGAERVDALDIDPFGFAACRRNARLNGLETQVRPLLLSLDLLETSYPLVLANLVADQIAALASLLRERCAPGGALIVSGFETEAEDRARAALGLPAEVRLEEGGWVGLLLRRLPDR